MFAGPDVAAALLAAGVTHIVWIPDSDLGTWNDSFVSTFGDRLIRVCREGEAFAIAAGLWMGGKSPVVILQCTGLFEAGDSLRNILHDLRIPIPLIVGMRGWKRHCAGPSTDTCPIYTQPILDAWNIRQVVLDDSNTVADLIAAHRRGDAVAIAE